jgi:hypothetical protein
MGCGERRKRCRKFRPDRLTAITSITCRAITCRAATFYKFNRLVLAEMLKFKRQPLGTPARRV